MDSQNQQQPEPVLNGSSLTVETPSPPPIKEPGSNDTESNNYDDLFPSLPSSNPIEEWKPKLTSSTITQVFHIPAKERKEMGGGFGGDESHKILKLVMTKSGAKVEMSASTQSLSFLISGKPDAVSKAKRELLHSFQTQANASISIPKSHHKVVLGKGGSKKMDIEGRTGTRIKLPSSTETEETITVTGSQEGIDRALEEIKQISDEWSNQATEYLSFPKVSHPIISSITEGHDGIRASYPNVRIKIPPPASLSAEIVISGDKQEVAAVCAAIREIYTEAEFKTLLVSVEVRKSQHKYVFGPQGKNLKAILDATGVNVVIPPIDSPTETVTLYGPQEKVGTALTMVYEKANSVVAHKLSCPSWLHKYIIGKKGASIQKLKLNFPKVHIEFMEVGDIKIEGPPEEVEKAKECLEDQVQTLTSTMSYAEVNVDSKYHKFIIGRGGATVNKLKGESDVMINIPSEEGGLIRIEGNKEGVVRAEKDLNEMVLKFENEREKDLVIENRLHRQLIGPKGERIQKVRDSSPNVQIIFPDLQDSSDIVKIKGPKDEVDKVSEVLDSMYKDLLENNFQLKVPIYKEFHRLIVGKGGATVRKIRTDTDTRVDIPVSGSNSDVITITGRKENVEKAYYKLLELQSEMESIVTAEVNIPSKIHNTIIGAGGKVIQYIIDDCGGVMIVFPPSDSGSDKVTIKGPKEDVEKAKVMLLEFSNEKQLSSFTETVRANPNHHKFLIGRSGFNIQGIRQRTGAKIIFPNDNDEDKELITILGTKEAVAAAKTELEKCIKDLDNIVEETMTVDQKYHRYFVARRGEVLRQIGSEFGGVTVSFPRAWIASEEVTLKGAKECVDAARKQILEIIKDLEEEVTIDCIISQVHHRMVMGPRGSKIQKVCYDFDVRIKIPEKNDGSEESQEGSDVIKITGLKEKCEKASLALQELVPVTMEVPVPFTFHRFIIGQKGAGVRALMTDYDVNIHVPPSELQSDNISIIGAAKNVEEARQALLLRVDVFEKEKADKALKSFEIKLEINPEYHPKIIGKKGAIIQQLRQEYDVSIQLPRKDSPDNTQITITGYEAKANEAKKAIMKIVTDIESMTKEEVKINRRVHPMIIGRRGFEIRRIMADYKVEIKLPREGDNDPDLITIVGQEEDVLSCKDHLLHLEEEYLEDVRDNEWVQQYIKPSNNNDVIGKEEPSKGFEVGRGAPWHGASDDAFPTLCGNLSVDFPNAPAWGPRK